MPLTSQDLIQSKTQKQFLKCKKLFEEQSETFVEECEFLIKIAKDEKSILAQTYHWLAQYHDAKVEDKTALQYYSLSLELYKELNDQEKIIILSYSVGSTRYKLGLYGPKTETILRQVLQSLDTNAFFVEEKIGCLDILGVLFLIKNENLKAKQYFSKAIKYAEEGNYQSQKIKLFLHISYAYSRTGAILKAFAHLRTGLAIIEQSQDDEHLGDYYLSIGGLYAAIPDYEEASNYVLKSIQFSENKKKQQRTLAASYANMASLLKSQQKFEEALNYSNKTLEICKEQEDIEGIIHNTSVMGTIMLEKGEYTKAISLFEEAFAYYQEVNYTNTAAENLAYIARAYLMLKQYTKSIETNEQAIKLYPNIASHQITIYHVFSQAYEGLNNYKKAHEYLKVFLQKKKDIEEKKTKELLAFYHQHELTLKEKETELLELKNKELKEMDVLKTRFFTNISHELRTPLTLILGPANTLLSKIQSSDERQLLKTIQRSGKKMLYLVEEVLDLSKLESGKLELQEQVTTFYPFVKRIFHAFQSGVEIKEQSYELSFWMDEDVSLQIDRKKLEKILNNLLSNAIKYTPQGGKIKMLVEELSDKCVQIRVKDSGRGISKDDLPYIFERYFQSNQKNLPLEGGTGIGLALVKEFAELMKGSVKAESKLGKGSTFTLQLPIKKTVLGDEPKVVEMVGTEYIMEAEKSVDTNPTNSHQYTILIVEDHAEMQQYIQHILRKDYQLKTASNGKIAWEMLQNQDTKIDLIVSDVMMPEMDGFTLLEKIKQDIKLLQIPVVMLTARSNVKDKLKALTLGVDDYLLKPFVTEELKVRIQNLLQRYQQKQEALTEAETVEETIEVVDAKVDLASKK